MEMSLSYLVKRERMACHHDLPTCRFLCCVVSQMESHFERQWVVTMGSATILAIAVHYFDDCHLAILLNLENISI